MAILNNNQLGGASGQGGGYTLDNSLRFRSSASAYLYSTESSSNRQTMTWSGWVKLGTLSTDRNLISYSNGGTTTFGQLGLSSANAIDFISYSSGVQSRLITTQLFRDASAWYHIIAVFDTTNATSTERLRLYINGERVTAFSSTTYPSINYQAHWNNGFQGKIGAISVGATGNYLDGYLTEVNFVDGQALTAADFGETNEDTGSWQPKKYSGSYGTNGFYLKGRGTDNSGNGNDWTENNFSTSDSTLTTYDIMSDVPTLTDEDTSNFATLNPLNVSSDLSITQANLLVSKSTNAGRTLFGTIAASSGKVYWEVLWNSVGANDAASTGISIPSFSNTGGIGSSGSIAYLQDGRKQVEGSVSAYGDRVVANDIIGVALDLDAGTLVFYNNNVSQGTAATGITGEYVAACSMYNSGDGFYINFGQRPFAYTPPSGFKKLNTFNLPDSNIVNGSEHFVTALYTGSGAARSINNTITDSGGVETGEAIKFGPDFVWLKSRSTTGTHILNDSVRGGNKQLFSNLTSAEASSTIKLTGFTSTGFTLGADDGSGTGDANYSGTTFAAWNWKAGGTGVSNTDGSITSTVSANTTAGFSIVSYTGTGSATTVGHGLGAAPNMIIVKNRDAADAWQVYHSANTAAPETDYLVLNTTAATADSSTRWNDTAPTSSVFSIGSGVEVNTSSEDYIAYCFADVEGYSKIGTYVGNGSTDGPFVYTGFRPAYVMPKKTSDTSDWIINDTKRDTYNITDNRLFANDSLAESGTYDGIDILSNGFKLRSTNSNNISSQTYIYMAFAENPFKNSLAR